MPVSKLIETVARDRGALPFTPEQDPNEPTPILTDAELDEELRAACMAGARRTRSMIDHAPATEGQLPQH